MARNDTPRWQELTIGVTIEDAGDAVEYETGDWKSRRPVTEQEKCNKCGLCFIYCPEGCIQPDTEGYFPANLRYCKGCGVCAAECPRKAITMIVEGE